MASLMRPSEVMPLREAMDRLFEQAFTAPRAWGDGRAAYVPLDVYESSDRYMVRAAVPGIEPDEIQISCQGNTLVLSGQAHPWTQEGFKPLLQETFGGAFRREITLPVEVDASAAEATYEHGILVLSLPKSEAVRPKTIKVKAT